jgi:hypothetical protein
MAIASSTCRNIPASVRTTPCGVVLMQESANTSPSVVDYDKDDTDNKVARYTIKRKREEATSSPLFLHAVC